MLGCFSERSKNNKYITKIVLTDMSTDTCYKCSLTVNGTDDTVTAQHGNFVFAFCSYECWTEWSNSLSPSSKPQKSEPKVPELEL